MTADLPHCRCVQRDEATEAVGCAIMILVRQEPAWDEAMRHADADTLIGKVRKAHLIHRSAHVRGLAIPS